MSVSNDTTRGLYRLYPKCKNSINIMMALRYQAYPKDRMATTSCLHAVVEIIAQTHIFPP